MYIFIKMFDKMSNTHSEPRTAGLSSYCSVCHRAIALTGAGVIRQHGPVSSRCPGAGRPPTALGPLSQGSATSSHSHSPRSPSTSLPPRPPSPVCWTVGESVSTPYESENETEEMSGTHSEPRTSGLSSHCSACHRAIALTGAGVICQHGPVSSRCPGAGRPPAALGPLSQSSATSSQSHSHAALTPLSPSTSLPPRPLVKILSRIPRASRESSAKKLATILEAVVRRNDHTSWDRLFRFSARCLRHPHPAREGRHWSLATAVNSQLREEAGPPSSSPPKSRSRRGQSSQDPSEFLASRVSVKLEEGDFRGAIRLACSEDMLADLSDATFDALLQKHLPPHPDSIIPPRPVALFAPIVVSEEEVARAIQSFPNGSAGGPDGLKPQHLKDMISSSANGGCQGLLSALTSFVTLVLEGNTPASVCAFFLVPI